MSALFCNFLKLKELGKGSFSTVYLVKRLTDSKEYAMKVVKITKLSEKERQNALNEIRILASLADSNIIGYKEAFFDEPNNSLCIIMEFADGGDVLNKINEKKKNKENFSEKEIWKFLIQMTKGLRSLHNLKILHRDLKCANVFLTKEGILKLGDLNVSKVTQKGLAVTQAGTPYYCAPEIWKASPYDKKCDIWSLGCVLYEIAAFRPPFRGVGMKDLSQRIFKGEFDRIPKNYSNDLSDLIKLCLKVNPNERPTCDEILDNPIIKNHFKEELGVERKKSAISKAQLLNTIKLPKNLGCLKEKLPKPNYNVGNNSFDEEDEFMQSKSKGTFYRCPSESDLKGDKDVKIDDFLKNRKQPPVVVERSRTPIGQRPNTPLVINENKNRYDLGAQKKVELVNRFEVKQENLNKRHNKEADDYKYELKNNNKYEVNKADYIKKPIVDHNQNKLADYNRNPSKVMEIVRTKPDYPPKYEQKYDQKYDHISNKQEYIYQKPSSALPQSRPKPELEDKFKNNYKPDYERYKLEEKKKEIEKNYEKPNYDKCNINPNPEKNRRFEPDHEKFAQKPKADPQIELLKQKKVELAYDYQNRYKVIAEKPKNDYSIEYMKQKKMELEHENANRNKPEVDPRKKMVQPQNFILQKEEKIEKLPPSKPSSRPSTGSRQNSRPYSQAQEVRPKGNNNENQHYNINNNINYNNQYNQYNLKEEMKKVSVEKKMMANKRLEEQFKQEMKQIPSMLENKENAFKRPPAFRLENYK